MSRLPDYDELYAEMVTSPAPPVELFTPWPLTVLAVLLPAEPAYTPWLDADMTQVLPVIRDA